MSLFFCSWRRMLTVPAALLTIPFCTPPLSPPSPALPVNKQQALYAQYAQEQSRRKIERTNNACKKKLQVGAAAKEGCLPFYLL